MYAGRITSVPFICGETAAAIALCAGIMMPYHNAVMSRVAAGFLLYGFRLLVYLFEDIFICKNLQLETDGCGSEAYPHLAGIYGLAAYDNRAY